MFGEDTNCDFAGSHSQPELGIFEGILGHVVQYAVQLPGWFQWGSGGSIEPYKTRGIKKITEQSVLDRLAADEKKDQLTAELARIQAELDKLN